jgi:hypothetical protein
VASNLQKRLDKIEKGIRALEERNNPTIPELTICMNWVEANHQEELGR